jgi:hypothetical protein
VLCVAVPAVNWVGELLLVVAEDAAADPDPLLLWE